MKETRIGNPDKKRFIEIPDPNYGGIFIIDTKKSNLALESEKLIKK